jgi:hydrogenase maturation factor
MNGERSDTCTDDRCITCGDLAVEMTVVDVDDRRQLAVCEGDGARLETVEIALVTPVQPGDRLLIHAGTAVARAGAGVT